MATKNLGAGAAFDVIVLLLSVTNKLMDKLPNYEQRKKEAFLHLLERYMNERDKDPADRDDNALAIYRRDLLCYIEQFNRVEIPGEELPSLRRKRIS